jgi:hypothetical protein
MKRYKIELHGETPLIMHKDNLAYGEKIKAWQKDPENKVASVAGDDRSPAWTWIGYTYHDGKHIGIDADNIMTMLREGGAKVLRTGKETYKKATQSGVMLDQQQFSLLVGGKQIKFEAIKPLIMEIDFSKHIETAERLGFELLVKRAKVGQAKHVRVRPMFREWTAVGSITVLDEELSGLTKGVIETVLRQAGALVGLCDWRPSSPKASGTFGRFTSTVTEI